MPKIFLTNEDEKRFVKQVNGKTPDANGNVEVDVKTAVEAALTEAKESGQFDGPAGPAGPAGADGKDGEPGPVGPAGPAGADGQKGDKGDTGPAGADGQPGSDGAPGKDGADGKTPVKGEDYFTPDEVQEIARQAAELVEVPEVESGLPSVTEDDNGKFLRVTDGVWAAVDIPSAEGGSF